MFDPRQQNDNTWKDVTPFPGQDTIPHNGAQACFKSRLDLTEAYEHKHIKPEDMYKITFSTIFIMFQDFIGKFIYIYLDDILIFSNTLEIHLENIIMVLQ